MSFSTASACFFPGSILRNKSKCVTRSRDFITRKPMCSSISTSMVATTPETIARRSANYQPSIWSFDHIQSLSNKYNIGEKDEARSCALKEAIKMLIRKVGNNRLNDLELVDDIQRLGISYHFKDEINEVLKMVYNNYFKTEKKWDGMNLNFKALGFRLLRQHGYQVPQEIFQDFKEKIQNLKPNVVEDMIGMLNLYEASYHAFEDENILDEARDMTTIYLKQNLEKIDESILSLVKHALELPLHWRVPRVEARWFIEIYEKRNNMNPMLIELAKLDYDMVQAIHIEDLKHASRWWRNLSWDKSLSFARDRIVESFLWPIGYSYLPHLCLERITVAKVNALITSIDDVYDVFGTLDELEKFTDVISRWDIKMIEELPQYMQICFFGLYNSINEIAYERMTNTGFNILPYLKQSWVDLCKAYMVEARWHHNGHTPSLKEYIDNAWISIGVPTVLMHGNFLKSIHSTEEIMQCIERVEDIIRYSSIIFRLTDDLGTYSFEKEKGDIVKSIQCYMHESGATEDEAKKYVEKLIMKTWKKLNKEGVTAHSPFLREFLDYAMNMARMGLFMYGEGDAISIPDLTKSKVSLLLFDPIQDKEMQ